MDKGLTVGGDNTPNALNCICPNCVSKPKKVWEFDEKRLHWAPLLPVYLNANNIFKP